MVRPTTVQDDAAVILRRTYPVDRVRLFDAWTNPKILPKWFAPTPEHSVEVREYDFRVGGRYQLAFSKAGATATDIVCGEFKEINAPNRVSYSWEWTEMSEHVGVETLVEVEFLERNGETELVLTHTRFNTDEMRASHRQGWSGCFEGLATYLQQ